MGNGIDDYIEKTTDFDKFLSRLGIEHSFFIELLDGDDWSCIVKSNALIESMANVLISSSLERDELSDIISRMDLLDDRIGKMAFIKQMNLLPQKWRRYIRIVGRIRNYIVHDVSNINFSLENYILSLDGNQKKEFLIAIKEAIFKKDLPPSVNKVILEGPKVVIVTALGSLAVNVSRAIN